ncbi:LON peptidase substrate-binding domain-containing protein [Thioalkalivibrio sp. XN8]|uniref:LON peptidase substrate-binding domain-containing protein n=1 Tax=Thioalkalivibrio sp. XN8 TaxID=2712863 RepID=UPI0013EAAF72|nr:LON peptidase substrate-binding domain-containing protein [Thioalkalivibrio sp. XN8]NGP52226.1 peptidase S16 [Thioalkalivibrio sp. XN8]
MSAPLELPLFPLQTVLFPGGPLPLRIFEPRYVDMIGRCMKTGVGFGVTLIKSGEETSATTMHDFGTVANIVDFDQLADGTLGVVVIGSTRFMVRSVGRQPDGLNVGQVELLEDEPKMSLPARFSDMARLLEGVFEDLGPQYQHVTPDFDDASWVGCRLAELLPIDLEHKQHCLELFDPVKRLEYLEPLLRSLGR